MQHPDSSTIPLIKERAKAPVYIGSKLLPVPSKLVKRIEYGQFMEMVEVLPDHLGLPYYTDDQSRSYKVKYKEVLSVVKWLQCFSVDSPH